MKIETYSVLRKKTYFDKVPPKKIRIALSLFEKLGLCYVEENQKLLASSYRLAEKLNEPVIYDCLYLALAKQEEATFITANLKFLKKAKTIYPNSYSLNKACTEFI